MKSLKMGKVLGTTFRRSKTNSPDIADPQGDGPEAVASRNVKSFCESSGPNNSGDEVLYLPPIVDAAESSPQAAAECARLIKKYLKKDYWSRPSYQYNAIMLMRILADNPGPTFTRNMDQKFADVVKEILRQGRDPSVRQMVMETLEAFENTKAYDEGLAPLIELWKKEKAKSQKAWGNRQPPPPQMPPRTLNAPPFDPAQQQNYFARNHTNRRLPSPVELASRLEEARTSAKLLQQVVTNTPPAEVLENDLIKEFADRCTSASRSIQLYMQADNPAPDNDTMESLIDTNEQLQQALSLHQRAMLNSRKHLGIGNADDVSPINGSEASRRASPTSGSRDDTDYDPPPVPPRKTNGKGKEREYDNASAGPSAGPSRTQTPGVEEDPFKDPQPEGSGSGSGSGSAVAAASSSRYQDEEQRLAYEPYSPGFKPSTTPSYVGRQESAIGKETMHGAVAPNAQDADDDDLYEESSKKKETMYRY